MARKSYWLRLTDRVTMHGPQPGQLLNDKPDMSPGEIDALVASGDCLITLATSLDEATQYLSDEPEAARPQLEKVIRTLLHLQRHYTLTHKTADHRQ